MCFWKRNKTAQVREVLDSVQIRERIISNILQFEISHVTLELDWVQNVSLEKKNGKDHKDKHQKHSWVLKTILSHTSLWKSDKSYGISSKTWSFTYILKILHIISDGLVYLMACHWTYWKSTKSSLTTWTLYTPDINHLHNMFYATKDGRICSELESREVGANFTSDALR